MMGAGGGDWWHIRGFGGWTYLGLLAKPYIDNSNGRLQVSYNNQPNVTFGSDSIRIEFSQAVPTGADNAPYNYNVKAFIKV